MTGGKIYTRPGREANNFGIWMLSIRLSSNLGRNRTSGVNQMSIWVPGPGDTAENSKRHGLRFWTSADFVILYIGNIQLPIDRTAADMLDTAPPRNKYRKQLHVKLLI